MAVVWGAASCSRGSKVSGQIGRRCGRRAAAHGHHLLRRVALALPWAAGATLLPSPKLPLLLLRLLLGSRSRQRNRRQHCPGIKPLGSCQSQQLLLCCPKLLLQPALVCQRKFSSPWAQGLPAELHRRGRSQGRAAAA